MPFRALGLGPKLLKSIQESGYTEPTPIQTRAIPPILAGADLVGIAQTGTGKTAAFVLPMLEKLSEKGPVGGRRVLRALVLTPTRELAAQIDENVRRYASQLHLRFATVYGGVGEGPQISALRAGAELVVATPGRLLDLMERGFLDYRQLEFLVLDEADRMLDMGFLPQIRKVIAALPKTRQTLLFSATLSKEIETLAREFLRSPEIVAIGPRATPSELVTQWIYETDKSLKTGLLLHLLRDKALDSVLVFSRTKHGADKIARKLTAAGISTGLLHSNRSQSQRMHALKGFKSGAFRVLVATDIAARGIDVDGISHVVNYDFPPQPEDYVHRIGRTGRAHAIGDAISFVTAEDRAALRSLERFIGRGIPKKKAEGFDESAEREKQRFEAPAPTTQRRYDAPRSTRPAAPRPPGGSHYRSSSTPAPRSVPRDFEGPRSSRQPHRAAGSGFRPRRGR